MYVTYESEPVSIAPPNTYTNNNMMAIGVMTVVMIVSMLRVMWRRDRPVRTAVSERKCVVIGVPQLPVSRGAEVAAWTGCAVVADDREEDVLEGRLLLDVFDRGGREQLLELGQSAVHDDPALVEDRDPVGKLFGFLQLLRGEQHRRALPREFFDRLPHLDAALWVEPRGRLVEEDHRRVPDEAHRDVEAAAHAAGVRRYPPLGRVGQREPLEQVLGDPSRIGQVSKPRHQHEVLPPAEDLVDGRELSGETDRLAHLRPLRRDVEAVDAGRPTVRLEQRGQDLHDRGLACSVRAEQGEDAPGRDVEVHAAEHLQLPERLVQPRHLYGEVRALTDWHLDVRSPCEWCVPRV